MQSALMKLTELKKRLETLRYSAFYNTYSQQCLHEYIKYIHADPNNPPFQLPGITLLSGKTYHFGQFVLDLEKISPKALLSTKQAANSFVTRNWVKEVYRNTEEYCKANDCITKMEQEPWDPFIRPYINAWSHGGVLNFDKQTKRIKDMLGDKGINYREWTLKNSMDGKSASLSMNAAYQICEDVYSFVDQLSSS